MVYYCKVHEGQEKVFCTVCRRFVCMVCEWDLHDH
jgi:hypothetical protein